MFLKLRLVSSRRVVSTLLAISLSFGLFGCENFKLTQLVKDFSVSGIQNVGFDSSQANLTEVAPPLTLVKLNRLLESSSPEVSIISPLPQKTLENVDVEVDLDLKGYSLFKDQKLQLGPHLSLILDNEPYQDVYDLSKPVVLENLKPGTHQLSVLVEKPWGESFKNPKALAQTTFNVLTETEDDLPLPLLIYNQPSGVYQAEPVLFDFYVTGLETNTWQVRATVNDEKFLLEQMQPIYLKGLQEGNNLIQLELLDKEGKGIEDKSNQPIRLITYEPGQPELNTLAKLVNDKLPFAESTPIVDQNYQNNLLEKELDEEKLNRTSRKIKDEALDPDLFFGEDEQKAVPSTTDSDPKGNDLALPQKPDLDDQSLIEKDLDNKIVIDPEESIDEQDFRSSPNKEIIDEVEIDEMIESEIFDNQSVRESDSIEDYQQKPTSTNLKTNSEGNNFSFESKPELSTENNFQQSQRSSNSVPTNSVSEKIKALTETHPGSLTKISPLPNQTQTTSEIQSLEIESEPEDISPEQDIQKNSLKDFQASLVNSDSKRPEEVAIAQQSTKPMNYQANSSSVKKTTATNISKSVDLLLEVSEPDNPTNKIILDDQGSNQFDLEVTKSQISSTLAIWLTKTSEIWQQFHQQALSLINKAITTWRANVSAS